MLAQVQGEKRSLMLGFGADSDRQLKNSNRRWSVDLPEMVVGEYLIVPLTSVKMLKSEGYQMNNCCREYSGICSLGEYLVFSIRTRSGERVATLGLVKENDYWQFDQCFGPQNSNVMEEVLSFCDENGIMQQECYPTELYYVVHEVVRLANSEKTDYRKESGGECSFS